MRDLKGYRIKGGKGFEGISDKGGHENNFAETRAVDLTSSAAAVVVI